MKSLVSKSALNKTLSVSLLALAVNAGVSTSALASEKSSFEVYYKGQRTNVVAKDIGLHLKPELRIQTRISTPFDSNIDTIGRLNDADTTNLEIQRARFKVGGNVTKNLKAKFEYDLVDSRLLDFRLTYKFSDEFQFRFGRMKAHYSPERVTSSKDQQLVDRSIVNNWFTIDRQQGVSFMGRLNKGTWADSSYWFDISNGTGRHANNENNKFMYVARYQWNFFGEQIETAMGDLKFRDKPAAHIAFSATTNESAYTKFSSSGAGNLPKFKDKVVEGVDDQFELTQWMVDFIYKYKGVSFQTEYHTKEVDDKVNNEVTDMKGYYVQAGFFPNQFFPSIPKNLELAARIAYVDPDEDLVGNSHTEKVIGANWFITGHRNKITFDVSSYDIDEAGMKTDAETRWRLQHDFSF